jgi:hypothetical protein
MNFQRVFSICLDKTRDPGFVDPGPGLSSTHQYKEAVLSFQVLPGKTLMLFLLR